MNIYYIILNIILTKTLYCTDTYIYTFMYDFIYLCALAYA